MLFKDLEIGAQFVAGMTSFEKIEPVELDGYMRTAVVISDNSGPLLPKGLMIGIHGDVIVDQVLEVEE